MSSGEISETLNELARCGAKSLSFAVHEVFEMGLAVTGTLLYHKELTVCAVYVVELHTRTHSLASSISPFKWGTTGSPGLLERSLF